MLQSWLRWVGYPYELAARLRLWGYAHGWFQTQRLPRPVISVGNLTVGGTGKTPVVMYVVDQLITQGKRVAILSRGYRRRSTAPQLLVSDGQQVLAGPEEAGDEPYLMARRCPHAVVAVGADRYVLGQWVLSRLPVDCFVLDDGYQHVQLHRDVNLLLVDATDTAGLRAALPVGRLREPLSAAARATAVLITRVDRQQTGEQVWRQLVAACPALSPPVSVGFTAEEFRRVGRDERRSRDAFHGRSAVIFSGIGNAGSFQVLVEELGITVIETLAFPDHVHYTHAMMETIRARAHTGGVDLLVTTEKDADKVAPFLNADDACWAVRLRTQIIAGQDRLERLLRLDPEGRPANHA
ncbi:MAG: tetraacyldisaccharide 4'-kinase [Nitrospira sp. SCN 59-13]|nr:MAG: tetraacyldisaccharide 4'-kinase [Nitrospira sp. SCN 59-13]